MDFNNRMIEIKNNTQELKQDIRKLIGNIVTWERLIHECESLGYIPEEPPFTTFDLEEGLVHIRLF